MKNFREKIEKSIVLTLVISVLLGGIIIPQKTQAQGFVPVHDAITASLLSGLLTTTNILNTQTAIATGAVAIKEVGNVPGISPLSQAAVNPGTAPALGASSVDFWARTVANLLITTITNDIVGWIDSGFQGSPGFVRDPGNFFLDMADAVAGDFIDGSELGFLCDPFELDIRLALNYRYTSSFEERISCRLTDVIQNIENFSKFAGNISTGDSPDFYEGGWSGWISLNRQNQYTSYLDANAELGVRIRGRQNIELLKLDWGNGFLSYQEPCQDPPGASPEECVVPGQIKTPGQVISTGISDIVGSDLSDLQLADGFDRIINALLNQLINKALGNSGLL